eukprot:sb/3466807/
MIPIGITCLTEEWIGGDIDGFFCRMFSICVTLFTVIPFNLLVVISIDKFTAVKFPLKYNRIITKTTVWWMIATCVLIPILALVPIQLIMLYNGQMGTDFRLPYGSCFIYYNTGDGESCVLCYVLYALFTALQFLPLVLIIIFYSLIFVEVKKQVRMARTQNLEKSQMLDCHKATITIFLLVVTYILTWLPEWLVDFMSALNLGMSSMSMYNFQIAARWIFFLSPMADPYIYALRHQKVQQELKRLLCPAPTAITKPDSKAWDTPFGTIRRLFTYQQLPSFNSDISHQIVHNGTRTNSLATRVRKRERERERERERDRERER